MRADPYSTTSNGSVKYSLVALTARLFADSSVCWPLAGFTYTSPPQPEPPLQDPPRPLSCASTMRPLLCTASEVVSLNSWLELLMGISLLERSVSLPVCGLTSITPPQVWLPVRGSAISRLPAWSKTSWLTAWKSWLAH